MKQRLAYFSLLCCALWHPTPAHAQPTWTQTRLFDGGQIYILPPEALRLEYSVRDQIALDGSGIMTFRSSVAALTTLPHRLQLGLALGTGQNGVMGPLVLQQESATLSWAVSRWGERWGNPVLSLGISRGQNLPPQGSLQLTLGDAAWEQWRVYGTVRLGRELSGFSHADSLDIRGGIAWQSERIPITWGIEGGISAQDKATSRFNPFLWQLWASPLVQWDAWDRLYVMAVLRLELDISKDNGTSTHDWLVQPAAFIGVRL